MTMEEDVQLPSAERLDCPHNGSDQLANTDPSQQQHDLLGKSQSRPGELISSLFNSLPRRVIEQ
jgi:hypothetical protein